MKYIQTKRSGMIPLPRDSDRTQTCNLLIRSQMLYSIKLRSRAVTNKTISMKKKELLFYPSAKVQQKIHTLQIFLQLFSKKFLPLSDNNR